jgi:nucleoside-diphosphate-sugar epimerase
MPISPYAVAKLAGEGYCRSFHALYGIETVALRYFNVFGPRQDPLSQYAAVIPNFVTAALEGQSPVIFGDGSQTRDFTYIANLIDANLKAMTAPNVAGHALNIASGGRVSLSEVVTAIAELTGRSVEPLYAPPRTGDIAHSMADIGRARDVLGFQPTVDFRTGLALTIDYFVESYSSAQTDRV